MAIIDAADTPVSVFRALRYAAITCAFLFVILLSFGICFAFYWLVFGFTAVGGLACTGLTLILPSFLLIFGAAMLLGNRKPVLVYVLLAAVLIVGVFGVSLPPYIDIIGSSATQPLNVGAYDFSFCPAFIYGRIALIAVGLACILISLKIQRKTQYQSM
jgi:hypothetical protein